MVGLLVLLNSHKGDQEIARLADDLDLEIDEILPSVEYAEVLGFVEVNDGRVVLTAEGKKLLAGSIRDRKHIIRDQLGRTTLYKALLRALESAPEARLTEEQVYRLIAFTTAPADAFVQNIINWGRYAEMFRYDSDEHLLLPARTRSGRSGGPGKRSPPESLGSEPADRATNRSGGPSGPSPQAASFASVLA